MKKPDINETCRCEGKRANPRCPIPRDLGLKPGEFNALAEWPDPAEPVTIMGSAANMTIGFRLTRQTMNSMLAAGLIERPTRSRVALTAAGLEKRAAVLVTEHGR